MTRTALAALAALALLLTGCAAADSGDSATDPGGRGDPAQEHELPSGADDVVLRIDRAGGFVPADYAFATGPLVLVTGDGRVLQPASIEGGTPQPRLMPYVQHTLDDAALQELVSRAERAGLLAEPPDYFAGAPQVTDMASTTVTITADGETWTHSAYALGFEKESGKRAALADFVVETLDELAEPDAEPYAPEAIRLLATELTDAGDYPVATAWPDSVDLARVGQCAVVDDPDAVADVAEAMSAPDDTLFQQDGRSWSVSGAVVLPGETRPCADR